MVVDGGLADGHEIVDGDDGVLCIVGEADLIASYELGGVTTQEEVGCLIVPYIAGATTPYHTLCSTALGIDDEIDGFVFVNNLIG